MIFYIPCKNIDNSRKIIIRDFLDEFCERNEQSFIDALVKHYGYTLAVERDVRKQFFDCLNDLQNAPPATMPTVSIDITERELDAMDDYVWGRARLDIIEHIRTNDKLQNLLSAWAKD